MKPLYSKLFLLLWAALTQVPNLIAAKEPDDTCVEILEFARSGVKTLPDAITGAKLEECSKLAALHTRILRRSIDNLDDGKIKDLLEMPEDAVFFSFKAAVTARPGDRASEVASRFRRDIQTLLEAVSGSKNLLFFGGGNLQRAIREKTKLDAKATPEQKKEADKAIESARIYLRIAATEINQVLDKLKLLEPFAALLQTYLVPFASTGSSEVPSALTATNQQNQVKAAGFLDFESEHRGFAWINSFGKPAFIYAPRQQKNAGAAAG